MKQWERILFLHRKLAQRLYPKASVVARELEHSSRTIRRDLVWMKYALRAPIAYDPQRQGYYYTEGVFSLPASLLSHSQLSGLLVARQALQRDQGSPWHDAAAAAFRRILECLPEKEVRRLENFVEKVSFQQTPAWNIAAGVWEKICIGLEGQETLLLLVSDRGILKTCRLDPYHLIVSADAVCLLGWDHATAGFQGVSLSMIQDASFTDEFFQMRPGLDCQEVLGKLECRPSRPGMSPGAAGPSPKPQVDPGESRRLVGSG